MALDQRLILDVALEIIDDRGLEAFTLRELGRRLDVSPMAAYRHFTNRSAIIDALVDQLLNDIRLPPDQRPGDPGERIIGYCIRARETLLAHPALVPVVAARPLSETSAQGDLIDLVAAFHEVGFGDDEIVPAAMALISVTLGLLLFESQRQTYEREQGPGHLEDRRRRIAAVLQQSDVPVESAELQARISADDWAKDVFEMAVRDCFDGLLRRATQEAPRPAGRAADYTR